MQNSINLILKLISKKINKLESKEINNYKIFEITSVDDFYNLTENELTYDVKVLLTNYLSVEELNFLIAISKLDINVKKYLKDENKFIDEQKVLLTSIINKLKKCKNDNKNSEEINKYRVLRLKFLENNVKSITQDEIDLIVELMKENSLLIQEQISVLELINSINLKIHELYKNDNIIDGEESDVIELDDLEVFNNDTNLLIDLFSKYNLDWNLLPDKFKDKLIKYGNIEKMDAILDYLNNKLPFILNISRYSEILTKILLCSSIEILDSVINTVNNYNLIGFIESYPSVLFPPVKESKRIIGQTGGNWEENKSGCSTYFLENVDYFLKIGKLDVVKSKCLSVLTISHKTIQKSMKNLELYGIDLFKSSMPAITVLKYSDSHDVIDSAIEAGGSCFEYIKQNLSSVRFSFHYLKYFIKVLNGNPFSRSNNGRLSLDKNCHINRGEEEKIFKSYGVIEGKDDISSKTFYDGIINNSDNNEITNISREHELILMLDNSEYYNDQNSAIYNFDGVIISRIKVLRCLETLLKVPDIQANYDLLLYVITLNSMIDEEEYKTIKVCLNKLFNTPQRS